MSSSLDPDQTRHFVGPDLDPNCLPTSIAEDTSQQRVYNTVTPIWGNQNYFFDYLTKETK